MPGCVLRVGGAQFAPDLFLAASTFRAYQIWHCGEPESSVGRRSKIRHESSGFCCDVSSVDGNLHDQVEDAIVFLTHYHEEFIKLAKDPTVEDCQLDFGFDCRLGQDIAVQVEFLPVEFLRLVGELSVAVVLSIYPPLKVV
jgi:hypothetical protein